MSKFVVLRTPKLPPPLISVVEPNEDKSPSVAGERQPARKGQNAAISRMKQSLPPSIEESPTVQFKGYFYASSGVTAALATRASLTGCAGLITDGTTTGFCIHSSFRIVRLTVWLPGTGTGAEQVNLNWGTSSATAEQALQKDEGKVRANPANITVSGALVFQPPAKSFASMWQLSGSNSTDIMFDISLPQGAVVLLEMELTEPTGNTALVRPGSMLGLTTGTYYRYSIDTTTSGNVIRSLTASAF